MIKERMLGYLPNYYRGIREVDGIMDAQGAQVEDVRANLDDVARQFHVDTATWGLARWERLVGLPESDGTLPDRRSAVKSMLQGFGTLTLSKVEELCKVYVNGEVEVSVDGPSFTLTITFTGIVGIPANFSTLEAVLRDVMPAHMVLNVEFRYMTWRELDGFGYTWDELDALNLSWEEFSEHDG